MISFLGLGLSRFTAGKLSVLPRQQDMTQVAAKAWIKRQEIDTLELPQASVREIRRLIF
jgi:DNA-binding phage protein